MSTEAKVLVPTAVQRRERILLRGFLEVGSPCRIVVRSEGMALGVFTGSNQPAVRCFELHREGVCIRSGALATLTLVGETMRQD